MCLLPRDSSDGLSATTYRKNVCCENIKNSEAGYLNIAQPWLVGKTPKFIKGVTRNSQSLQAPREKYGPWQAAQRSKYIFPRWLWESCPRSTFLIVFSYLVTLHFLASHATCIREGAILSDQFRQRLLSVSAPRAEDFRVRWCIVSTKACHKKRRKGIFCN